MSRALRLLCLMVFTPACCGKAKRKKLRLQEQPNLMITFDYSNDFLYGSHFITCKI